ncbi:geranylgeranyl transferase type I beta subunit [Moelleriella libera RCEF 2490]|uniref:Geranylgeranyl transferase type I beta subunit n=1 Tax=Moelleriella libera RCEF 2490 TaxID=1081109 RepID=A0A167WK94_9HYPO|nr:geranylgeranyl transferase type I beta subunit [Moelleriella libera RCEF 2490]
MALNIPKHIEYWRRCFDTFLPSAYTTNDSTRLTFAFFIVSALDLLSVPLSRKERSSIRTWVLSLQHPDGGFCGSPTHAFSGDDAGKGSANLAATFFALVLLGVAADSDDEARGAFADVRRKKLLCWMKKLQRSDGSFGQVLWEGEAVGGRDTRHSYLMSCIRWMLRGDLEDEEDGLEEDIDVKAMIEHLRCTQVSDATPSSSLSCTTSVPRDVFGQAECSQHKTYDGGVAETSEHESHGTFKASVVAAMMLTGASGLCLLCVGCFVHARPQPAGRVNNYFYDSNRQGSS